ncbi:MAG: MscL family protein [Candidatus Magasanikbacteria bacterium]
MIKSYLDFLKEYKIVGLALGVIMGTASTALVQSLVQNIIMPIISIVIPSGGWREASFSVGSAVIRWGPFLAELINFIILAFVVFLIVKKVMRWENIQK